MLIGERFSALTEVDYGISHYGMFTVIVKIRGLNGVES